MRLRCGRWSRLEPLRDFSTMPRVGPSLGHSYSVSLPSPAVEIARATTKGRQRASAPLRYILVTTVGPPWGRRERRGWPAGRSTAGPLTRRPNDRDNPEPCADVALRGRRARHLHTLSADNTLARLPAVVAVCGHPARRPDADRTGGDGDLADLRPGIGALPIGVLTGHLRRRGRRDDDDDPPEHALALDRVLASMAHAELVPAAYSDSELAVRGPAFSHASAISNACDERSTMLPKTLPPMR